MAQAESFDMRRLVAAEQAARAAGESAAAWWKHLVSAADAAITTESLEGVLSDALAGVRSALGADSAAILLSDESEQELLARASTGMGEDHIEEVRIRSGRGMAGRVMATRQPMIVDDLSTIEVAAPSLRDSGLRSLIAVPIMSGERFFGVLHVGSFELNRFTPTDAELLELLGERLAVALNRVSLFEEQARLTKMWSFFAETTRAIAEVANLGEAVETLAELALNVLGDVCLIDVMNNEGGFERLVAKHRDPSRNDLLKRLRWEFAPDPDGTHPAVEVIRTGQVRWSSSVSEEFLRATTRDAEHLALIKELGFRSYAAVPIAFGGDVLGCLTLVSCRRPFRSSDVEFAKMLSEQVGAVLSNARRYELSAEVALALQYSMLPPSLPWVDGVHFATRYEAASKGLEVGGDFYDLALRPDGKLSFMIGDVAGHDRGAAAIMGQLRSAARALAAHAGSPADLIGALRVSWDYLGFDRIASALFGELDVSSGQVRMASAGHYPPLLVTAEGVRALDVRPEPPLGGPAMPGPLWTGTLQAGQTLFLYTDGAIDERRRGIEGGMDRLMDVLAGSAMDPEAVCDRTIEMIGSVREDDVALLALQMQPR